MAYSDFPRTQWAVDFDRIFRRHRRSTTINFCLTSVSGFETRSPKFRLVRRTVVGYGLRPTDWAASLRESHLANIGATIKLIVSTKMPIPTADTKRAVIRLQCASCSKILASTLCNTRCKNPQALPDAVYSSPGFKERLSPSGKCCGKRASRFRQ